MTDIRKCAQAVIDKWKTDGVLLDWVYEDVELIEALRQALAAPVEPVVEFQYKGATIIGSAKDIAAVQEIMAATPEQPSVDALIAEAEGIVPPDGMVLVPVDTLSWWVELAEINPKDLRPRIQAMLAAAPKGVSE